MGPQGETGSMGFIGPQGETGSMGPQGEIGPSGSQGEIGPSGFMDPVDSISKVSLTNNLNKIDNYKANKYLYIKKIKCYF